MNSLQHNFDNLLIIFNDLNQSLPKDELIRKLFDEGTYKFAVIHKILGLKSLKTDPRKTNE